MGRKGEASLYCLCVLALGLKRACAGRSRSRSRSSSVSDGPPVRRRTQPSGWDVPPSAEQQDPHLILAARSGANPFPQLHPAAAAAVVTTPAASMAAAASAPPQAGAAASDSVCSLRAAAYARARTHTHKHTHARAPAHARALYAEGAEYDAQPSPGVGGDAVSAARRASAASLALVVADASSAAKRAASTLGIYPHR
jgi:hypothetical protein